MVQIGKLNQKMGKVLEKVDQKMKISTFLLGSVCCITLSSTAFAQAVIAADTQEVSFRSILSTMNVAGESNAIQYQVAPTYSELFGFGVRTTVGGYVADDFALGAIIDYAEHREEYLANAGLRLSDTMRVVGSAGLLKEEEEFVVGEGREDVRQLEYGLSLKGNYDAGIVRGFEVNAYKTNASSDSDSVETGDLTGVQVVSQLKPSDSTDVRIGAGFERAEWASGETDEGLTLQALGSHKLSDTLSMNFEAKSAETENVYSLGLAYDMSTADIQHSAVNVNLMQIEGKHGISDDTRVAINWTIGLGGAGSASGASDATAPSMGSVARADLLADVMSRPAFLPTRVIVRVSQAEVASCPFSIFAYSEFADGYPYVDQANYYSLSSDSSVEAYVHFNSSDPSFDYSQWTMTLGGVNQSGSVQLETLDVYPNDTNTQIPYAYFQNEVNWQGSQTLLAVNDTEGMTCSITLQPRLGRF